jgi:hypothetical protein
MAMRLNVRVIVIPARAWQGVIVRLKVTGAADKKTKWVPAFAGMTVMGTSWAFAGMTAVRVHGAFEGQLS